MKTLAALSLVALCGCFRPAAEILADDPRTWSARDALTVAASEATGNLRNQDENFLVIVTPFLPGVVQALSKMSQISKKWDETARKNNLDALLKDGTGLFIDDEGQLWSARGNRVRGTEDIDSLLFSVVLINRTWPCESPTINGIPIMRPFDVPCTLPDISDLETRIILENAAGETLRPSAVIGRENATLMTDERIFVRFSFVEHRDFLEAGGVRLRILGWESPLDFEIPDIGPQLAEK